MKALDSPLRLFVLFGILLLGISGCNNQVTDPINDKEYPALSEENFSGNSNISARAGSVIAVNLEPWFSPKNDSIFDTGLIGEDLIPYRFTDNVYLRIRMESSSRFNAFFQNSVTGEEMLFVDPVNTNSYGTILAGDYILHLNSWENFGLDSNLRPQVLFIQSESGQNNLFISAGCKNCDLSGAKLNYMNFVGFDFSGSNFANAQLRRSIFSYARLTNTNLATAYFFEATLFSADLSYSNMKSVTLRSADLRYANLGGSDITNGDLRFSDISGTNFCGANKTGIITNGIFYNNAPQCWP